MYMYRYVLPVLLGRDRAVPITRQATAQPDNNTLQLAVLGALDAEVGGVGQVGG